MKFKVEVIELNFIAEQSNLNHIWVADKQVDFKMKFPSDDRNFYLPFDEIDFQTPVLKL